MAISQEQTERIFRVKLGDFGRGKGSLAMREVALFDPSRLAGGR